MKKILAMGLLGGFALQAQAQDVTFGLGVGVESGDSTIYAPIDFGEAWRLEPSLRYLRTKASAESSWVRQEQYEFGVGAFKLVPLHESVRLYLGGRVSYLDGELKQGSRFGGTDAVTKLDGYRIAPTVGFEYSINKYFSIGGEAEWFYLSTDNSAYFLGGPFLSDQKTHGTDTRLVVRVRF